MKLDVRSKDNKVTANLKLPVQFTEEIRPDLIKRAVLAIQHNKRQPYGAFPLAGKRSSAFVSKRRHKFRSTYGIGQSRTPRKVMSLRGSRFIWEGAFAPQTVGGRRAHAPKASKSFATKINKKERLKAIRSALAATMSKTYVTERGHKIPETYPFIISKDLEAIEKTKDLQTALAALGLDEDLARADGKKIRAGKGTMRGRRYKNTTSALIVTASDCPLLKAAKNIAGVTAVTVENLNAELLAPGTTPGRLTLFSEGAISKLENEHLFIGGQNTASSKIVTANKKTKPATPAKKTERSTQTTEKKDGVSA